MVQIVRGVFNRVNRLKLPVRRILLDKEFYSLDVFRTLDRRRLAYGLPVPVRRKQGGICQFLGGGAGRFALCATQHQAAPHLYYPGGDRPPLLLSALALTVWLVCLCGGRLAAGCAAPTGV